MVVDAILGLGDGLGDDKGEGGASGVILTDLDRVLGVGLSRSGIL
jgi:hypothetical protein